MLNFNNIITPTTVKIVRIIIWWIVEIAKA